MTAVVNVGKANGGFKPWLCQLSQTTCACLAPGLLAWVSGVLEGWGHGELGIWGLESLEV